MNDEIEAYIAQRSAEGLAVSTIKQMRFRLAPLAAFLRLKGVGRWQDATHDQIDAYLLSVKRSGLSLATRQDRAYTAQCFLAWLADSGRILSSPAAHVVIETGNSEDQPLPEPPLDEEDVADLIASMPRRNALDLRNIALVELMYSGGLRLGETLALDARDIDLSNHVVHIRRGKGEKARDVPMMRGLQGALKDWLCLRRSLLKGPDHGALLLTRSGKRISKTGLMHVIGALNRKRKGKPHLHPHLFRHSIAVHLLRSGMDVREIQFFLGHSSIDSTMIYLRLVPADLRKAYDAAMPEVKVEP